jgi:GntR family transcriptional regulator/MocR family aminotransferase
MVMPMEVRLRLLEIAERCNAWIVEDDYDSEYRFRGHPVPAMQGLDDSGRVIYVGTLSKTMFPSIRVAYLVVPKSLVEGFRSALNVTGQHPPLFLQAALADFITEGFFSTHLKRMRRLYAQRMQDFVSRCQERLAPWLTVEQRDTGMQVAGWFTEPRDDGVVLAAARRRAVDFAPISSHYRFSPPAHGLFLGYAGVDREHAERGVERLRMAFEDIGSRPGGQRRPKRERAGAPD